MSLITSIIFSDGGQEALQEAKHYVQYVSKYVTVHEIVQSYKLYFRRKHETEPTSMRNINFSFSMNTANTMLRGHLEENHADKYVQVFKDNRWTMLLPRMWQMAMGEVSMGPPSEPGSHPCSEFSCQMFLQHIINFIIADNQV